MAANTTLLEAEAILRNPEATKQEGMRALEVAVQCLFNRAAEIKRRHAKVDHYSVPPEDFERWMRALESYPRGEKHL